MGPLRPPLLERILIAVFAEDAFDHDAELGTDGFLRGPVNGYVFADGLQKFAGYEAEG
jgi:hypothetical protein